MALSIEERFAAVVAAFSDESGVISPAPAGSGKPRRFGDAALRVDGKIFAMLVRGTMVVKLPRARVAALIAAGDGGAFDAGRGRPMAEWVALEPSRAHDWVATAREALLFVRSQRKR